MESTSTNLPTWSLVRLEETGSTNDHAATQPAWTVVTAQRQTKGRGRYRRSWVSDEGGLWMSAVLPTPGRPEDWSILPLAAGWALKEALGSLGVQGMRLRWPNDLMIGNAKLAGILVERFRPDCAVIGLGVNYLNAPASVQPELSGMVRRLADILDPLPAQDEVMSTILAYLGIAQNRISAGKTPDFLPSLNSAWQIEQVVVTLQPDSRVVRGSFTGVDAIGNLLLLCEDGTRLSLPPTEVQLLRELR